MPTEIVWHYEYKGTYNCSLATYYEQEMLHDTRGAYHLGTLRPHSIMALSVVVMKQPWLGSAMKKIKVWESRL